MSPVKDYRDLRVFQQARMLALQIHEVTKTFPKEEKYSLVDQARRSSRSVCANIAEAWRKRRYRAAFIAKLNDAEGEAAETQVWVNFAKDFKYMDEGKTTEMDGAYHQILCQLTRMINQADSWILK